MEGITNQYTCTCITAFIHRDLCFHFSMPISWIYDKSLVTNAIIKSGCRFRKSCFDKYRRLTGTFRSSTGVGEKWEKALIYLYCWFLLFISIRDDGQYNTPIALPNSRPFYLLRFTSPCQMVKGMYVREESVDFDDEDHNNKNSATGKHPLGTGGGRNQRLMYCYYSHLRAK